VITVLGTRFTVWQRQGGGRVLLRHGQIRFEGDQGRRVELAPGQQLRWPAAPEPKPTPPPALAPAHDATPPPSRPPTPARAPGKKARARPASPPVDIGSLLDRVERLRLQGRYAEAARILGRAISRVGDRVMKERLSFEQGTVLTDHLSDGPAACRHWRRHLRAHGSARYGAQIAAAMARLECQAR